jgi:adenylosuccinate synthase
MAVVVVVGAQWGDEGKGKVVDLLSERADVVVRYGGGANAGHTLVIGDKKIVTHLVPSGVLHPGKRCVLGDGMVIDPRTLLDEIAELRAQGLLAGGELMVSARAHVILPYHRWIEALREDKVHGAIGTTRRGIGPAYEAKAARRGVRIADLLSRARLVELVSQNLDELIPLIVHHGGNPPGPADIDKLIDEALACGEALAPHIGDTSSFIHRAIEGGRHVLFEGAQGTLLDLDHGTYPFVTSSSTLAGGACTGAGVGPTAIDRVIGISKAYCTRVGGGPFPTEMPADLGEAWRTAGGEFGATTGRPRRCGWLDLPALRLAVRLSGMDSLAITKLDVACGRGPIELCVAYDVDGVRHEELPVDLIASGARAQPVYRRLDGWDQDLRGARSVDDLPSAARAYLRTLEAEVGVPFALISVGPDRAATLAADDPFGPAAAK